MKAFNETHSIRISLGTEPEPSEESKEKSGNSSGRNNKGEEPERQQVRVASITVCAITWGLEKLALKSNSVQYTSTSILQQKQWRGVW